MQPPGGKKSYEELTVDILRRLESGGVLTDVNPGSAVRTLVEAFARQLALAYEQLAVIYDMGFIDTAEGEALDHLVALLGQKRRTGPQAVGEATFERDPKVAGQVVIPEGTALQIALARLPGVPLVYLTRKETVLAAGQTAATAEVYTDLPAGSPPETVLLQAGDVPAAATLTGAIAGVGSVAIRYPTAVRGQAESDADLRERVKGLIVAAGGGTAKALEQAALGSGLASSISLRDAQDALPDGARPLMPGELEVVAETDAARRADLRRALVAAKGPGIHVRLRDIDLVPVTIGLILKLSGTPGPDQREALKSQAESILRQAMEVCGPGDKLRWNPVMAQLLRLDGVADIAYARVTPREGGAPVDLIKLDRTTGALTIIPEYPPAALPKYSRVVLADSYPAIAIELEQGRTIYMGVSFDKLPKTLQTQVGLDAGQLVGAMADALEGYLESVNQAMAQAVKAGGGAAELPKLVPADLTAAVYKPFGSYFADKSGFAITYWDPQTGVTTKLLATDEPVGFSALQVLRPGPDSVVIGTWE
jgi:hypothetical protein